jgi:hypothetical protein
VETGVDVKKCLEIGRLDALRHAVMLAIFRPSQQKLNRKR